MNELICKREGYNDLILEYKIVDNNQNNSKIFEFYDNSIKITDIDIEYIFEDIYIHSSKLYIENSNYRGRGIPDAIIFEIKNLFNKNIRSSRKASWFNTEFPPENRTSDATKVWKRLVSQNHAIYIESEDYYVTC